MWLRPASSDSDWSQRLFESETALLRWFAAHSARAVPVPHLLHVLPSSAEIPRNAFVTQGMTGGPIKDLYPMLSPQAKVCFRMANYSIRLLDNA